MAEGIVKRVRGNGTPYLYFNKALFDELFSRESEVAVEVKYGEEIVIRKKEANG